MHWTFGTDVVRAMEVYMDLTHHLHLHICVHTYLLIGHSFS